MAHPGTNHQSWGRPVTRGPRTIVPPPETPAEQAARLEREAVALAEWQADWDAMSEGERLEWLAHH